MKGEEEAARGACAGRMSQAEGTACAKAPKQGGASHIEGTARRPVWLEKGKRGGERKEVRVGRGQEQVMRHLVDLGEDLSSYLEGGGSPGGLWVDKGRDLTPVLAGALWWLLRGGQTIGSWLERGWGGWGEGGGVGEGGEGRRQLR